MPGGSWTEFRIVSHDERPLQDLRLSSVDKGLRLSIELYADEEAARTAPTPDAWEVESDEVWTAFSPLALTEDAERIRSDPMRFSARHRLAGAFAKRPPVIPVGFMEAALWAWIAAEPAPVFDDPVDAVRDAVVAGASGVLERLENDVTESLRVPWWEGQGHWEVEIKDGALRLGRGLGRIPLSELGLAE